jgi:hypothetical protein
MIRNYCLISKMKAWTQILAVCSLLLSASGALAQTNGLETGQVLAPTQVPFIANDSANLVPTTSVGPVVIGQSVNLAQPVTVARPALATQPVRTRISSAFPPPAGLTAPSGSGRITVQATKAISVAPPAAPQRATPTR